MEQTGDFPSGRFEKKYLVTDQVAVAIRDALMPHLELDSHMSAASARGYAVYSVYYDSPTLDLYQHTRQRAANRFKLRVRFYDHDPQGVAFIEIKEKIDSQVHKRRFATNKKFVEALLRDPNSEPVLHELGNGARGTALEEFWHRRQNLDAAPKLFVAYDREAYNSTEPPLVRVTFDRRITANPSPRGGNLNVPRFGSNVGGLNVLLEFKYAGEPPQWLTDVLLKFRLRRASFSKFAECVDVLGLSGKRPRRHKMRVKKNKNISP
jgi:hypothetical protein